MNYKEVEGDLVALALEGRFDVVAQGNNCFCVQGAGLAPQFVRAFGTDKFPMEDPVYKGNINKLGMIDYKTFLMPIPKEMGGGDLGRYELTVINCYTQYGFGSNHDDGTPAPADYEAITLCMRKINKIFAGSHVGLPMIGCGLAGGDWEVVKGIIQKELKDCQVTVVIYKK